MTGKYKVKKKLFKISRIRFSVFFAFGIKSIFVSCHFLLFYKFSLQ